MAAGPADDLTQMGLFKGTEVWSSLLHTVPLLTKFLAHPLQGMVNLKIVYRGKDDFLAVAKQYSDTGIVEVCFGSGADAVGALVGLEVAMESMKWRPDKWLNG